MAKAGMLKRGMSTLQTTLARSPPSLRPDRASDATRIFSDRKAHLFDFYRQTFEERPVILLYRHQQMTVTDLQKLRIELKKLSGVHAPEQDVATQLVVTRTGILSAVSKVPWPQQDKPRKSNAVALGALGKDLIGPTLMVVCPSLVPPLLKKCLDLFERAGRPKAITTKVQQGASGQRPRRMEFVVGLVEGQRLDKARMKEVAELPRLDTLQGQIVSLIASPASQLGQILDHARGSRLINLLSKRAQDETELRSRSEEPGR